VGESVRLRVQIREREMQFFAQCEGGEVFKVGPQFDAALLCDERAQGGFTGTYIGMACHDKTGQGAQAYFSEFRYSEY
jgi:xylan 1,4-beta-xylosidase